MCKLQPDIKALSEETADFFILKLVMKIASALCLIFIKVFNICVLKIKSFLDAFSLLVQNW